MIQWIGLTGRKGAGKDAAAHALISRGYRRIAFADPVREMTLAIDPYVDEAFRLSELVEKVGWDIAKRHPEVRRLLQRVGTEAGRGVLGHDIWIETAKRRLQADVVPTVFTDIRFDNEAEMVKSRGGVIVEVVRPGLPDDPHVSESGISRSLVDAIVSNATTLTDLHRQILAIARGESCITSFAASDGDSAASA